MMAFSTFIASFMDTFGSPPAKAGSAMLARITNARFFMFMFPTCLQLTGSSTLNPHTHSTVFPLRDWFMPTSMRLIRSTCRDAIRGTRLVKLDHIDGDPSGRSSHFGSVTVHGWARRRDAAGEQELFRLQAALAIQALTASRVCSVISNWTGRCVFF